MIRVAICDDSRVFCERLKDRLAEEKDISVEIVANSGSKLLDAMKKVPVDVITLDQRMQGMSGVETLEYVMSEWLKPVIIVSAFTTSGADETIQTLENGAIEIVLKPRVSSRSFEEMAKELIEKIRMVAEIPEERLKRILYSPPKQKKTSLVTQEMKKVIVIAASTGGPNTVREILSTIPEEFPAAILIVQHMTEGFTVAFAERLNQICALPVHEAKNGEELKGGRVYVAPAGSHLYLLQKNNKVFFNLKTTRKLFQLRPAADITIGQAASLFGENTIAVILSGSGHDGLRGCRQVLMSGGVVIAQDPEDSVIEAMPKAVIENGLAQLVLPAKDISRALMCALEEEKKAA